MPDDATLCRLLDASVERNSLGTALIWQNQPISFANFTDRSRRLAQGLRVAGIAPGDRVAIWMPNCPEWLELAYACWRIGAAIVVINIKASVAELADFIRRSSAHALACWPGHAGSGFQPILEALQAEDLGACRLLIGVGSLDGVAIPAPLEAVTLAMLGKSASLDLDMSQSDAPAIIYMTSGSTGRAKLVLHAQGGMAAHSCDIVRRLLLDADDAVQLLPLPLAGAYGATQAFASITAGRPLVLMETFDPTAAADAINRHHVTGFCAFDEVIHRIMRATDGARPFPTLRWCGYGIFNPGLATFIEDTERRGVKLIGLYGSSETQAFFATQRLEAGPDERHVDGGWPLSAKAQFRIRDMDSGALLGPGLIGEIEVAGPSLLRHYLGDDEANAAQICPDGFFRTGDSGRIGSDGGLVFEARMQDVLRLSGYLVAAKDIESVVARLPGIERCQVVGLRTPEGARPVAFVIPTTTAPLDEEALRRACTVKLARYKVPVKFHPLTDFPMTGSVNAPKVNKRRLGEMAIELSAVMA